MAKLCYVEGDYQEAISQYSQVALDDMQLVGAPVYRLSMIAEAHATKGQVPSDRVPSYTGQSSTHGPNVSMNTGLLITLPKQAVGFCHKPLGPETTA